MDYCGPGFKGIDPFSGVRGTGVSQSAAKAGEDVSAPCLLACRMTGPTAIFFGREILVHNSGYFLPVDAWTNTAQFPNGNSVSCFRVVWIVSGPAVRLVF